MEKTLQARRLEKEQMRANFEAIFQHYGLPVPRLLANFGDRCFWNCGIEFLSKLQWNTGFDPWPLYGNHGPATSGSWRERVNSMSMQIVQHGKLPDDIMIETDFDLSNPDRGLAYMLLHLIRDVLLRKKVTPQMIAERLRKRGIQVPDIGGINT